MRYDVEKHPDIIYKLCILGLDMAKIADVIGISLPSLETWKVKYPDVTSAFMNGGSLADAEVSIALRERAMGYTHKETKVFMYKGQLIRTNVNKHYPPDTNAAQIWLVNRQRALWSRNPLDSIDDAPPVSINFNVVDARCKKRKNKNSSTNKD